jgi:hypothetical protein
MLACKIVCNNFSISGSACLRTLLVIPSGPGALFGATLRTAFWIWYIVIVGSYRTGFGWLSFGRSVKSAGGAGGKKDF